VARFEALNLLLYCAKCVGTTGDGVALEARKSWIVADSLYTCTMGYHSKWHFCIHKEGIFTFANFDSLPGAEKLIFDHKFFGTTPSLC